LGNGSRTGVSIVSQFFGFLASCTALAALPMTGAKKIFRTETTLKRWKK
jgi:hypothetical protein